MTQEEKELLLKDLCARLPYGVIVNVDNGKYREDKILWPGLFNSDDLWDAKPYLRPMSSMTEEEDEWINDRINFDWIDIDKDGKRYAALTLFADNKRGNIFVKVHFPLRQFPKRLIPDKYEVREYEHNSNLIDYKFEDFIDACAYMFPVAKQMYRKKVESYNQRQIIAMLGESFINAKLPYRLVLEKEYKKPIKNIVIYTKEPNTVFTTISMGDYKKAVCEVLTFNAKKVFRQLGYELKK